MKIYKKENVYTAALDRIRFLFREFENVMIYHSGGKDSTIVLELSLIVAREMKRLPLRVAFIDQEAEWQMTIDHIRELRDRPEIKMRWYQTILEESNASSKEDAFFKAWDPAHEDKWIRPKEEKSIKRIPSLRSRVPELGKVFNRIPFQEFGSSPVAAIGGMRAEESPKRFVTLTKGARYKGVTWAKYLDRKMSHFTFYPVYDWSYTDVWKAIHEHGWNYCKLYDFYFQYGTPVAQMRVSSLCHSLALSNLFRVQEIEPETYSKIINRLPGAHASVKFNQDFFIKELPFMFRTWREYRDYLLDHLIQDSLQREYLRREFVRLPQTDQCYKVEIASILSNDHAGHKLKRFK
jgi:predicted phosphoadenosine phosphosulfate sulfurtransferase